MKTVHLMTRALILAMLFSTAFVLVRPVFAEQEKASLAQDIRAQAELAAKQLQRNVKTDLKKSLERPVVEADEVPVAKLVETTNKDEPIL